jgi:hypothetical protein
MKINDALENSQSKIAIERYKGKSFLEGKLPASRRK